MHVIDSHTGGEPTRVILDGGPDLGSGSLAERAERLATEYRHFCSSVMLEPRGQVAMVAALLVEPTDPDCIVGVIYFDTEAVLGMCGHGTIGLGATLVHLGRITPGRHKIETPAGIVTINVLDANTVTVTNVESRRAQKGVSVEVEGIGTIKGDVAYGGNWFFIVDPSPIPIAAGNIRQLTDVTIATREALKANGIVGDDGGSIEHVIFYGPAERADIDSRNFVLCPDDAYDRSPCGTGSSARMACLAADGRLAEGEEIVQESVIGSSYRLSYRAGLQGGIIPSITGKAFVMAESRLIFDQNDPFKGGIFL